jgi:oxalate decarboxylase
VRLSGRLGDLGETIMADLTRRAMLGAGLAAGGLVTSLAEGAEERPHKAEEIPNFKFSLESSTGKVTEGGSAKEATILQLPISKGLAGVSMRLKPGAMRELHWHAIAAEWAYMLKGRVRGTVIDPEGNYEVLDFEPGDVWYFPRGHGHALQGLGPDEAHFILGFDDGAFSEHGTFSVTDWLALTPPDVLARNLDVPASTFADFPKKEVYIGKAKVPPPHLPEPKPGTVRSSSLSHKYQLLAQEPRKFPGGTMRVVSSREFPISTTMTGALMTLDPGALRELHWHPNADEWQYIISGRARIGLFGSSGRAKALDFNPGDVAYLPRGFGHYVDSIGEEECKILVLFNSGTYQEIALSSWLASNPTQLVADHFGIEPSVVEKFPKKTRVIKARGDVKAGPKT